jgi:hypothetical protein
MDFDNNMSDIARSHAVIDELFKKYETDEYMTSKITNYVCVQLEGIFGNMKRMQVERAARIEDLTTEQDNFIHSFLHNNQYFYAPSTDNFFYYDGLQYQLYNEDDILYNVLSSISKDRHLMSWKHRTKINVMKRIKENNLINTIPESETIQMVIDSLCPAVFASRAETKYFLTILGDNILRKQTNTIYFVSADSKYFIRNLNNLCNMFIGVGLAQTFKYKYHDHSYSDCRLVRINECVKNENVWTPIVKQHALNIIAVACHYSVRYNSADEYLLNMSTDEKLVSYAFYIKNLDANQLLTEFISKYIDIDENNASKLLTSNQITSIDGCNTQLRGTQITWKNMQYLWRHFLDEKQVPPMIFLNTLKNMLISRLSTYYNNELDAFVGICSHYLPSIQTFLNFWNNTMILDDTETDLEVGEILVMYRKWCETNNETSSGINDKHILDLVAYYYPNIEIERDKYISKIRCSLWDKQLDIQTAMDSMKETIRSSYNIDKHHERASSPPIYRNISIYDAYLFYCKNMSSSPSANPINLPSVSAIRKQVVSKSYFEKYIYDNYYDYIIESKFLSQEWYL